jgi:DNA polymerase-3 subunit beta
MSEGYTSSVSLPSYAPSDALASRGAPVDPSPAAASARVDPKALRAALAVAVRVAPKATTRMPHPALALVRMTVERESLAIDATDLETTARLSVPCDGWGAGTVTVDPRALAQSLRGCTDVVTLHVEGDALRVGGRTFTSGAVDEWPVLWPVDVRPVAECHAAALRAALDAVTPALAREQGRYAMHGARLDVGAGLLVGTDGLRLHVVPIDGMRALAEHAGAIVPRAALVALAPSLPQAGAVTLSIGKAGHGPLVVSWPGGSFEVRCIDAQFPRWRAVVPSDLSNSVDVEASAFLDAVAICRDATSKGARAVRMTPGADGLVFYGRSVERGEARAVAPFAGHAEGDIAGNPDFLRDAVKACGSVRVRISWNDRTSPMRFDPLDAAGRVREPGTIGVVMPISVDV